MSWPFPKIAPKATIHKIDGYFLSITISLLFFAIFRYNWAYLLVTTPTLFVLHRLLYFNFRIYRYVIAGLSSFMWGVIAYVVGLYVIGLFWRFNTGFQIIMLFSMAAYVYSMFAHYREFKGWHNIQEISVENLSNRLRKNKAVKVTIGISSFFYLCFLVIIISITFFGVNPNQWAIFRKKIGKQNSIHFTQHYQSKHRLTEPIALYSNVDERTKIGEIHKGTHCDTILNWALRQGMQYNERCYYLEKNHKPSWCTFDTTYSLAYGGWFRYDTTDPYFKKVAYDE
jgi:hypothetical protein